MKTLNITAVINNATPAQWVVDTLEAVDNHHNFNLNTIIVQSSKKDESHSDTTNQNSILHKIGRQLLHGYINRPRFEYNALTPTALPDKLKSLVISDASTSIETQDVVLQLGNIDKATPQAPKTIHGTWTVNHQDIIDRVEDAILTRKPLLWMHLWKIQSAETNSFIRLSSHSLPMQTYSISDAISYGFGTLPDFISSRLNWLANGYNPSEYEATQIKPDLYPDYAFPTQYQAPKLSGVDTLVGAFKLFALQTQQRIRDKTRIEQWQIGFMEHTKHPHEVTVDDYKALTPPGKTIWADPHLIVENNETHVFFEAMDINDNHGRIDWAVLTPEGFANKPKPVLTADHHLSYPFLFKHDNDIYMVPETAARRAISLYKAKNFPEEWEYVSDIMENINAADSTMFQHEGLWWMFTNGISHKAVDERDLLMLFYTDDFLSGDWQSHPMNPVVTGIDRARMGGAVYEKDGELFRPSQYGAKRYGYGVNTSKIQTLSKTDYQETLVGRITPSKHDVWMGCHTFTQGEKLTVVDRLRRIKS